MDQHHRIALPVGQRVQRDLVTPGGKGGAAVEAADGFGRPHAEGLGHVFGIAFHAPASDRTDIGARDPANPWRGQLGQASVVARSGPTLLQAGDRGARAGHVETPWGCAAVLRAANTDKPKGPFAQAVFALMSGNLPPLRIGQ